MNCLSEKEVAYQNGEDVGYKEGHEDVLLEVVTAMSRLCGKGCPFKEDCKVMTDEECIERIIDCFEKEFKIYGLQL